MNDLHSVSADGIHQPSAPAQHRDEGYEHTGFETPWTMQERHFWCRGRHRFPWGTFALGVFRNP